MPNPSGLCLCGCGKKTALAAATTSRLSCGRVRSYVKGQPVDYATGHQARTYFASRRTTRRNYQGYVQVKAHGHPNADSTGYIREHVLIVSTAVGHALPPGAEVHHVNGDRADNRHGNLVACQDHSYHMLLHYRAKALKACGNANWWRCCCCGEFDAPETLRTNRASGVHYHKACMRERQRLGDKRRREARQCA